MMLNLKFWPEIMLKAVVGKLLTDALKVITLK